MFARLIIALTLITGLVAGPVAQAACLPKVQKACCKCCATTAKPCGMAAKTACDLPVPNDQTAQHDCKPLTQPQMIALGEIQFFAPAGFSIQLQKCTLQIPHQPPLVMNCIRLI